MKHFDDLTKIDVPWGELDEDTKDRLSKGQVVGVVDPSGRHIFRQPEPITMTRQQVLERFNVVVTEDRKG
jgi:hypothetical protein